MFSAFSGFGESALISLYSSIKDDLEERFDCRPCEVAVPGQLREGPLQSEHQLTARSLNMGELFYVLLNALSVEEREETFQCGREVTRLKRFLHAVF